MDQPLPFVSYLPDVVNMPQRVDLIVGCDLVWQYFLTPTRLAKSSSLPLGNEDAIAIGFGKLWLSSGEVHDSSVNQVQSIQPALVTSHEEVKLFPLSTQIDGKQKISPTMLDLPFLATKVIGGLLLTEERQESLKKLEKNPLECSLEDDELAMSISDEKVLQQYQLHVEVGLENGERHLQFELPWISDKATMPENYAQAKTVLLKLRKRLQSQPDTMKKYCEKLEKAINEGHLTPIHDEDNKDALPKYYIPHFHTSQAKFRVVYDAARENQGVSLNQLLARGPIFMQSLQSILIRFGEKRYGIAADISNMFFQIRVYPGDQDMLRILWFVEPNMQGKVKAFKF